MAEQSAQVVIFNEDKSKILLLKRQDFRIWVPPGGHVEEGESTEAAAIREVFEETGYEVSLDYYVGEYRRPQIRDAYLHVYAGHIIGGDVNNHNWEALAIEWFDADNLPKRTFSLSKEVIQDARFATELPITKTQYLPAWLAIGLFFGLKVRDIHRWILGR